MIDYLRARELVTNVYLERRVPLSAFPAGAGVEAVAYIVDRDHAQYAGALDALCGGARGARGKGPSRVRTTPMSSTRSRI